MPVAAFRLVFWSYQLLLCLFYLFPSISSSFIRSAKGRKTLDVFVKINQIICECIVIPFSFFGNLPRLFTFRGNRLIIFRMNDLTRKSSNRLTREQEREASRYFGRHVTPAKALVSLCFALLTAASPMLLGLHLWEQIPEIVETGLTTVGGEDDSLPRAVLVFGLPGLMCVLTLIGHGQLWLHQKTGRLPPAPIRITGRWSIPVISVLLCSFWHRRAAGLPAELSFFLPCLLALLLILLGAHFFDCPRDSQIAFRFPSILH